MSTTATEILGLLEPRTWAERGAEEARAIDPRTYDGDDVDDLAAVAGWTPSDWEKYHEARELAAEDDPEPGTVRVTLDLTPEQITSLVDVLDSGQQAIGDTTDRMEGEEYGYYDDGDRATQRAFREAADAVVAVAIAALDAARKAAGL